MRLVAAAVLASTFFLAAAGCSGGDEASAPPTDGAPAPTVASGGAQHDAERHQEPDEEDFWPETAPVRVPSVTGMTLSQAAAALRAAGLDVAVRGSRGTVVAQSLPAGRRVARTTTVTVTVE